MIQISNIKLPPEHTEEDLYRQIRNHGVRFRPENVTIIKKSLDARKKQNLHYLYTVQVKDGTVTAHKKNADIREVPEQSYEFPVPGTEKLKFRPVVIGAGPAGLFAALWLAKRGYAPILIERGAPVEERAMDVQTFWNSGRLNPESNVQFGEGGAGTFSDGKLNTQVKDVSGRIRMVLQTFADAGADPSIRYWYKPHIGTDVLRTVVSNIRSQILSFGGEILFHTCMRELVIRDGQVRGVILEKNGTRETLEAEQVILAIGHSARDTFQMLQKQQVPMSAKAFAVGVRAEHPQEMIQQAQYGDWPDGLLPVADYKVTGRGVNGRGVYSFCMCPGGQVVNASSEEGLLAVNGMSNHARDGKNANSALIVAVNPSDYPGEGPLAGIAFQRELERRAFLSGEGRIPVQLFGDFKENRRSAAYRGVLPDHCGGDSFANLRAVLPEEVSQSLILGMEQFGGRIPGFDRPDVIFSGVESRTSSPVRIERDEHYESPVRGLFPCGEGAGYAGGITSAAVDGIKIAEEIMRRFRSWT